MSVGDEDAPLLVLLLTMIPDILIVGDDDAEDDCVLAGATEITVKAGDEDDEDDCELAGVNATDVTIVGQLIGFQEIGPELIMLAHISLLRFHQQNRSNSEKYQLD